MWLALVWIAQYRSTAPSVRLVDKCGGADRVLCGEGIRLLALNGILEMRQLKNKGTCLGGGNLNHTELVCVNYYSVGTLYSDVSVVTDEGEGKIPEAEGGAYGIKTGKLSGNTVTVVRHNVEGVLLLPAEAVTYL